MALVRVEKGGGVSIGANDRLLASFILMGGALFLGWKYYTKHGFLAADAPQRTESPNAGGSGGGGYVTTPGGSPVPQASPADIKAAGGIPPAVGPPPAGWKPPASYLQTLPAPINPFKRSSIDIDGGESMLSRDVG